MRPVPAVLVLTLACAVWAVQAGAQPPATAAPPQVDVRQLGPRIGEAVPAFQLVDQHGAPRTLASVLGPSGGLLVFFRSADW